jgi:hypothetical protein
MEVGKIATECLDELLVESENEPITTHVRNLAVDSQPNKPLSIKFHVSLATCYEESCERTSQDSMICRE